MVNDKRMGRACWQNTPVDISMELLPCIPYVPQLAEHFFVQAAKVTLVDALRNNASMAGALASYHALTGTWRTLLADTRAVEALGVDDVRDVAARTFSPDNCFTGYVLPPAKA